MRPRDPGRIVIERVDADQRRRPVAFLTRLTAFFATFFVVERAGAVARLADLVARFAVLLADFFADLAVDFAVVVARFADFFADAFADFAVDFAVVLARLADFFADFFADFAVAFAFAVARFAVRVTVVLALFAARLDDLAAFFFVVRVDPETFATRLEAASCTAAEESLAARPTFFLTIFTSLTASFRTFFIVRPTSFCTAFTSLRTSLRTLFAALVPALRASASIRPAASEVFSATLDAAVATDDAALATIDGFLRTRRFGAGSPPGAGSGMFNGTGALWTALGFSRDPYWNSNESSGISMKRSCSVHVDVVGLRPTNGMPRGARDAVDAL